MQKAVAYSLTGSTREQCLFILFGLGANGKSTFLNVIGSLLGEYARQTRTETILVKRGDQIPNDVARLAGSRFVSAIETESGRRLAEGLVKQMTGNDRMTARFLHREFFEFEPTFKLWLAVNHKPKIMGTDHAIWRRIRLIPFAVTIPENERDPDLIDKLKEELQGILRWAIEGLNPWLEKGLGLPEVVRAATEEYRTESDLIESFLEECCEVDHNSEISKKALYDGYVDWCKGSGEEKHSATKKEFGARLSEKGFTERRTKRERFWRGIRLLEGDTFFKR
jgi:putative DNA primase/helicase